jgi:hypothetical protein
MEEEMLDGTMMENTKVDKSQASENLLDISVECREIPILFECESCEFETNIANELEEHKERAHLTRNCTECDYKSNSEYAFQLHMEDDHVIEKVAQAENQPLVFPCPVCGTNFDDISDLKLHVDNRHEKPKDQEMMEALDVKHYMSVLMEENLDLFEELKRFKKSIVQSLKDILGGQEDLKCNIEQLVSDYSNLKSTTKGMECEQIKTSSRLDDFQDHFQNQLDKIENQNNSIHKTVEHVNATVSDIFAKTNNLDKDRKENNHTNPMNTPESKILSGLVGFLQP